nr:PREDICTED: LOW QUALITY PROTEIN: SITS-binding protein-like [Opisthocomus hoazin]
MPLARPTSQIPNAAWTSGFREMTEPWKGAVGCLGVAIFFAMTIGIISWQALEQPLEEWVDRCWHDGGQFCYTWEEDAELRLSLEPPLAPDTECYSVRWTPLRPDVMLKDCFSMANVSWYGGASIRAQRWPLNRAESQAQPFVSGDFSKNPAGYGPVLERYFLSSTGVTVMVAHDVPLFLSLESNRQFCLGTPAGRAAETLRYVLCISPASFPPGCTRCKPRWLFPPHRSPIWRYYGPVGSAAKIKRGLRSLAKRLKRHHLQEGVLALGERCTGILAAAADVPWEQRKRHDSPHAWDPALIQPLKLSLTLSPYASIASPLLLRSLYWLSLQPRVGGCSVPLLTTWQGRPGARRDELAGDRYAGVLAAALATLGNTTVISAGARSSHLPLFVQMSPQRSDWSHAGLKGVIPSVLHYSLLGYNFFIPDVVGGSLAGDATGDPELYVRWLQIVTFLPVMAFSTPPWLCCDAWVLNLTRQCIQRHRDFVVPLLIKYSEEWLGLGYPIFRPAWWLSPTDPTAFTVEDEFLIGDEVLVAPITEKGQMWRDVYLPGKGHLWMDTNTARVFDGGTMLRNYSASLAEVLVFVKTS